MSKELSVSRSRQKGNKQCRSGDSPTSVLIKNSRSWDLSVDVSFDDSIHAEATLSSASAYTGEESECHSTFSHRDPNVQNESCTDFQKSNCAAENTVRQQTKPSIPTHISENPPNVREENPFISLMTNLFNLGNSEPGKNVSLPEQTTNIKELQQNIPLIPQNSNQGLTDMSCFDDSILWAISEMCSPSMQLTDYDSPKLLQTKSTKSSESPEDISIRPPNVKHRVEIAANAQAKYTQDLRYATTFDYTHNMDILQTTKSFGDDLMEEEFVDGKKPELPVTLWIDTFGMNAPCENFLPGVCLPFSGGMQHNLLQNGNTSTPRSSTVTFNSPLSDENQTEGDYYYDSDPESIRFRHRRPRRAFVREGTQTDSTQSNTFGFGGNTDDSFLDIELDDDETIEVYVEEMKHATLNIIWHPSQCTKNGSMRIMRSRAWIEMGSLLSQTIIHPKFMWKAAYEPNLFRRKINAVSPNSIDLLDIIGIYPVDGVDRHEHPFARPWCSFKIVTVSDRYFLFEAENKMIRDKIVFGLKLIVARLASKVLMAGEVAEEEFFSPGGRQVHEAWWVENESEFDEEEEEEESITDELEYEC